MTVAPRGIVVAYAIARRTANSGEMSTFARPDTPVRPNRLTGAPGLPDYGRVDDGAMLDGLEGVDPDAGMHYGVLADETLIADHDTFFDPGTPAKLAAAANYAAAEANARPEVGVVVHDGALEKGVGPHPDVTTENGVLPQRRAGLHTAIVPNYGGAPDLLPSGRRRPPRRARRPG